MTAQVQDTTLTAKICHRRLSEAASLSACMRSDFNSHALAELDLQASRNEHDATCNNVMQAKLDLLICTSHHFRTVCVNIAA